ncbi:MAG: alpha/beta hydrolase [Acidimicrobiia bacterium]
MASSTQPFAVAARGVTLSGWLALPSAPSRGLVIALHGHGMTAGYFTGPAGPDQSLLDVGAALGYTVWAPDRPGYGASEGIDHELAGMFPQAELLLDAIRSFRGLHEMGAGCVIVGHSFGLKLALTMASMDHDVPLLGIDGSGSGLRYTFEPGVTAPEPIAGDLNPSWGPRHLYPASTFVRGVLPVAPRAFIPPNEAAEWPGEFRAFAAKVRIPVRFSFGDHERLWEISDGHFADLRALLTGCPRVEFAVQEGAGHNVSLSHAARAYHLKALAFADECLLRGAL